MLITVSGLAGTGKSTLAKSLAEKFKLKYLCAGDMIRKMAEEQGMDVLAYGEYLKNHPELDREVDNRIIAEAKQGNAVLEGRLSAWMVRSNDIPAFKLLLKASPEVAAKRVVEREGIAYEEALNKCQKRDHKDWERFNMLYGISQDDESWYDLVVDTDKMSIPEVFALVLEKVKNGQNG